MNTKRFKLMAAAMTVFAAAGSPWAVAQAAAQQQIELFHRLPDTKAAALKDLVERFNAQSKDVQVVLSATDWRKAAPHMLILEGDDEEDFVAGKPRFKPLHALMKESGAPLQTLRPPAMMTRTPVNAKGQLLALPVGLFGRVQCRERAHEGRYEFRVEAALPLVGLLVRYEGWLEPVDPPAS